MGKSRWLSLVVLAALVGVAAAGPVLAPYTAGKLMVSLPQGWKVTTDLDKGVVAAQQDPSRKDAAVVLLIVQPRATTTEDQLLDAIASGVCKDLKIAKRDTLAGGHGRMIIGDGTIDGVAARVGLIALVANGGAVVGVLAARPADFEALGGVPFVTTIVGTMRAADSAPPPAVEPPPTTGAARPITKPARDRYGSLIVPPVGRKVEIAELAGEWSSDGAGVMAYVNSGTGTYAGFSSAQTSETWTIDAKGNVASDASYAVADEHSARGGREKKVGTASIDANNVLTVQWKNAANPVVHYIIRGWVEFAAMTVITLNGPFYQDGVPAKLIANPNADSYRDGLWARARPAK